jgi:calcineurin-like phosphoesterase family protein
VLKIPDTTRVHFISDTHFNHARILEYTKRPYKTLEEMNEVLIKLWQERVAPEDIVIHCGDFAMGKKELAEPILKRLPGRKWLARGNHDKLIKTMNLEHYFEVIGDIIEVQRGENVFVCCHFPIEVWNNAGRGWAHMHGHSHGTSEAMPGRVDVGVDAFCAPSGAPRSWEEVGAHLAAGGAYEPRDHHGAR